MMKRFLRVMPLFLFLTIVTMGTSVWAGAADEDQDAAELLLSLGRRQTRLPSADSSSPEAVPLAKKRRAKRPQTLVLEEERDPAKLPLAKQPENEMEKILGAKLNADERLNAYLAAYKKEGGGLLTVEQWQQKLKDQGMISESDQAIPEFRRSLVLFLSKKDLWTPLPLSSRVKRITEHLKNHIYEIIDRDPRPRTLREWKNELGLLDDGDSFKNRDFALRKYLQNRNWLCNKKGRQTGFSKDGVLSRDALREKILKEMNLPLRDRMKMFFEGYFESEKELEQAIKCKTPIEFDMDPEVIEKVRMDSVEEYARGKKAEEWGDLLRRGGVIKTEDTAADIDRCLLAMSEIYPLLGGRDDDW